MISTDDIRAACDAFDAYPDALAALHEAEYEYAENCEGRRRGTARDLDRREWEDALEHVEELHRVMTGGVCGWELFDTSDFDGEHPPAAVALLAHIAQLGDGAMAEAAA